MTLEFPDLMKTSNDLQNSSFSTRMLFMMSNKTLQRSPNPNG